jgi:hypothetical protein
MEVNNTFLFAAKGIRKTVWHLAAEVGNSESLQKYESGLKRN